MFLLSRRGAETVKTNRFEKARKRMESENARIKKMIENIMEAVDQSYINCKIMGC